MLCHNSVSSKIKVFNSVIWVVSCSEIQSVCCIHCGLSFDWATPECTNGLEKLLHNVVLPVASWKLGLPLSFTFCELHAAGELSLNQKMVMMRASVLFRFFVFFFLFQVHRFNPVTHGFHFMWLSKPISSFASWLYTGQKQEHFISVRSLRVSLAKICLLFCC